jgi:hypothetical protein
MPVFQIREKITPERALVVAPAELAHALGCEMIARGVACDITDDIHAAAQFASAYSYDTILVRARQEPKATALLLRLLRATSQQKYGLILLLNGSEGRELGDSCLDADEIMAASLSPARIVLATGLGHQSEIEIGLNHTA